MYIYIYILWFCSDSNAFLHSGVNHVDPMVNIAANLIKNIRPTWIWVRLNFGFVSGRSTLIRPAKFCIKIRN